MRNAISDVLVVGAGPTGLTLAGTLALRGVRVRVVEAASEPAAGSRGKGLQPRTLLRGVGAQLSLNSLKDIYIQYRQIRGQV